MSRDSTLKKKQYQRIRDRYWQLKDMKDKEHSNVPKYHPDKIWEMLCDEFLLTRRTLEGIVYFKNEKQDNQPTLFDEL